MVGWCRGCGYRRRTVLLGQMICHGCYVTEPKATCGICGEDKRFVADAAGVCPDCVKRAALPSEIECAKCVRSKAPGKAGGIYCKHCAGRLSRGKGVCSGCGKNKSYYHKKDKLCSSCSVNQHAKTKLRRDLETVSISNESNLALFRHLVERINWETVNEEIRLRLSEFARFLQSHHFDGPLSWVSIHKLKADLPGLKYYRVRYCLEQLGELLLDPLENENLEDCKRRNKPVIPISLLPLPANVSAVFKKYDLWLSTERKNTFKVRRDHFFTLGDFWKWGAKQGLASLAMAEAAHVEEYLHILGLKWTCRHCSFTKNIVTRGELAPTVCENVECRALYSFEKVIRCAEESVRGYRSQLGIFYGWLKDVEQGIEKNPTPNTRKRRENKKRRQGWRRTRNHTGTIEYYDWEVIDALLKAIEDPNMPAEEAMVLYLILHHAFHQGELAAVRIPSQCRPRALGGEANESLENVLSLEWLPRELSRGKQSLGRSGRILKMEPADEPWLRDLVRRFMRERNQKLRNPNNPYLFVGARRSPRGGPVSYKYFRALVESATARVTGRACTTRILGKCAKLLYSEFGGNEGFRHLAELGVGEQGRRSYAWAKRVRVIPRRIFRTGVRNGQANKRILEVPATDVFGNPTAL